MFKLAREVCEEAEWIGVEKIHGSNLSITFFPNSIQPMYASRNGFLPGKGAKFFNHTKVLEPYLPGLLRCVEELRAAAGSPVHVQFFGELFGGGVQKVNVVFYCPEPDFAAFDCFVNGAPIHRDQMFEMFAREPAVPFIRARARGKLKELLSMPAAFPSELHAALGHPKPKYFGENLAEGMVLQPVKPVTIELDQQSVRIMLKHKNPSHQEAPLKLLKPAKPAAIPSGTVFSELPEEVQALISRAQGYVNLNRLGNVLSKVGEFNVDEPAERTHTVGLFVQDAFVDFGKDATKEESALLKQQQRVVRDCLAVTANAAIDEYTKTLLPK